MNQKKRLFKILVFLSLKAEPILTLAGSNVDRLSTYVITTICNSCEKCIVSLEEEEMNFRRRANHNA
jgi:hypothetical protein